LLKNSFMESGLKKRATPLMVAARVQERNGKSKRGKTWAATMGCPLKKLGLRCGCGPHGKKI
jgi:hypothetical protein